MEYVMSIERIAEKRGREQGIEQGIERGVIQERKAMILRLLTRKLGTLQAETIDQIQALSLNQLEDLVETLLELGTFEDLEDLTDWLVQLQQLKTDNLQALTQKFGPLPEALGSQIGELSLVSLTSLGSQWERLETVEALQNWVAHQVQPSAN
jgi:Domain of unknown function (DUF4351)